MKVCERTETMIESKVSFNFYFYGQDIYGPLYQNQKKS